MTKRDVSSTSITPEFKIGDIAVDRQGRPHWNITIQEYTSGWYKYTFHNGDPYWYSAPGWDVEQNYQLDAAHRIDRVLNKYL
jgi:hypothetical protein